MTVYYTKEHEWVNVEGDTATVGITDYAQEQLGDVVFVQLPDVGASLAAGDEAAVIESVKAAGELDVLAKNALGVDITERQVRDEGGFDPPGPDEKVIPGAKQQLFPGGALDAARTARAGGQLDGEGVQRLGARARP